MDMKIGRSREGAWIEIRKLQNLTDKQRVAPARERGLKLRLCRILKKFLLSLPRGSVD